jgi:phosphohistidine swiveling domain-containing protein
VLGEFAPRTLMPSLVCGMALSELQQFIREQIWDADPATLAQSLSAGGPPSRTLIADAQLFEVGQGKCSLPAWLTEHGHRATGEFDLASPRWREQPAVAEDMARRLAEGANPMARHEQNRRRIDSEIEAIGEKLSDRDRHKLRLHVDLVRRYVAFREDGKDFFMLGYDLLRDIALEAGRRLEIGGEVFYLSIEDLFDALRVGFAPMHLIEKRKAAYEAEVRLILPSLIDADAIGTLGQPPPIDPIGKASHRALAVSSGVASGPARILESPSAAGDIGNGYILVCPSTDPSWTPLFVNAAGLIIERGGILSHGAVVARELGLPAVVLPNAVNLLREGQHIQIDAVHGRVIAADNAIGPAVPIVKEDVDDTSIAPGLIPPPAASIERRVATLSKIVGAMWVLFLLAFFLLPTAIVQAPALKFFDVLLWPIVRTAGYPVTVAIVAVTIAVGMLLIQKLLTDNARLLEAKRRAAVLKKMAELLPTGSRRRGALLETAAPVQVRTFAAGMVPICLLLGPLVVPFVWFRARVDPASWNAPAGSVVQVVALMQGDWESPVVIELPGSIQLDDATPASITPPPVRKTLQRLLALYRRPRPADPQQPWEIQAAPDLARQQTADDLQAYLDAGIPATGITWTLRPPESMSDRFPIRVSTEGHEPVTINAVVGNQYPPAQTSVRGPANSPINELKITYPPSKTEPIFWRPLGRLAGSQHGKLLNWLGRIDVGWFWLYILVYLPTLLLTRRVLQIA